jgi:NADH dehydrogenase
MESTTRNLVVVGSGFAGVWAALSAARARRALGLDAQIAIQVISPNSYLGIRPRFYESDLAGTTVELSQLFAPLGIEHVRDRVVGLDPARRALQVGGQALHYDALVWAPGSVAIQPALPGAEHLHSVDTLEQAAALDRHLRALAADPAADPAGSTAVVVGGGFTGLETATELCGRLRRLFGDRTVRVVLVERGEQIAPEYGPDARAVIRSALAELGVELRTHATVAAVTADAVRLTSGEPIAARTVVWTAGVTAHPATRWLGPPIDPAGRIAVDAHLRVAGHDAIWAAGDAAHARVDGVQVAMMSCQHALPQGKYAGHNALRHLAGRAGKRYQQRRYLTCLDLGAWGALVTRGFDRNRILATRDDAKALKRFINTVAIYPPSGGDPQSVLRAAAPPAGGRLISALSLWALSQRWLRTRLIARAPGPRDQAALRGPRTSSTRVSDLP